MHYDGAGGTLNRLLQQQQDGITAGATLFKLVCNAPNIRCPVALNGCKHRRRREKPNIGQVYTSCHPVMAF